MMNWQRLTRTKIVIGILAIGLIISVPALADDSVTLTINGGGRTANVTEASLQSIDYSHEDQWSEGTISLTIDDSSASGAGWNVTLQAGDFVDGERSIPASNFVLAGANGPVHIDGNQIDEVGGPKVPGSAAGSLDSARKVLHAEPEFGAGTYSQVLDVELLVPGQTTAGSYTSNLTVNITAGP